MRGALVLGLVAGCANLAYKDANVCGNGVLDPGEDCDSVVDPTLGAGLACDACHYVGPTCPDNWKSDTAGICRHGNGTFTHGLDIADVGQFYDLADVDGDGNLDLISAPLGGAESTTIHVYFGRGDGTFGPPLAVTALDSTSLAVGDLDGDGRADLVYGWENGLAVTLGESDQTVRSLQYPSVDLTMPAMLPTPTIVPVRADGQQLATLVQLSGDGATSVLSVVGGTGTSVQIPEPLDTFFGAQVAHANVDHDATRDGEEIALAFEGAPVVYVESLTPDGRGTIERARIVLLPTPTAMFTSPVFFGDFDGDGNLDVIASFFDHATLGIAVALGNGDGTFGAATVATMLDGLAGLLAVADLDGDGVADYVTCNAITSFHGGVVTATSTGLDCAQMIISEAAIGDFDRDGRLDVALGTLDGVAILYNRAAGFVTTLQLSTEPAPSGHHVRAGDFDGDGIDDLAVAPNPLDFAAACSDPQVLHVIYGVAQGQPGPAIEIARFAGPTYLETGRLQDTYLQDGLADIVAEVTPCSGAQVPVTILEGQPAHAMLAPFVGGTMPIAKAIDATALIARVSAPDSPNGTTLARSVNLTQTSAAKLTPLTFAGAPADFCTIDARCAVVATGTSLIAADGGSKLRVFIGTIASPGMVTGAYRELAQATDTAGVIRIATADLDDDGHPDLVLVTDQAIAILRGIDDLATATLATIAPPVNERFVDAVPLNADADPQLELAIATSSELFLADHETGFALVRAAPGSSVTARPRRLLVADLDRDGVDDIVFADDRAIHVLLGNHGVIGTGPRCGDGVLDPGEVCDDGNNIDGDGCSANCLSREACGNGIIDSGETCDDGNTVSGDGCSSTCQIERCGNGIIDPGESCDDGNTTSGDGCSNTCQIEP